MPSTRRRFLLGAAALAGVAGCNERSARASRETVTPVEVPRTDQEIVREAMEIDAPSVPSAIRVSDAHWAAAVDHVETLRDSVEELLESTDGSSGERDRNRLQDDVLERADDRLESARETGPSEEGVHLLRRIVRDLARADGYLRAERGTLDATALRSAVEAEREATDALLDGFEYRIARPVEEVLPTAFAAERALEMADSLDHVDDFLDDERGSDGDAQRRVDQLASVYRSLEVHRRRRDEAERYIETATDPDERSLRPAIDAELDDLADELATVAEQFPDEERSAREEETVAAYFEEIRSNVGRRTGRFRSQLSEHRENGRRLHGLFRAQQLLVEYESVTAAIDRTKPLLDGPEFPTSRLLTEKRRAVESVERVADGTPLQRYLARRAARMLESADRFSRGDGLDTRALARMHLMYAGAAGWAELALDRGDALTESLQAQQS